tara:strand:+ start:1783 stop:2766 length:984 start_codon:yes stop_codon:yes gene_type:complete
MPDPDIKKVDTEKKLTAKELREKMIAERKAKILSGGEGTKAAEVLTAKELREKMLRERKAKILGKVEEEKTEEKTEEELTKDPNLTPLETEKVVEEVTDPASSTPKMIKKVKPVAKDGYIYDDKLNRYKKIEKVWKDTGILDEQVWANNTNGVREKYDNYEEYKKAAEEWRRQQKETQIIKEQRKEVEEVKTDNYEDLAEVYSFQYDWDKLMKIFKGNNLLGRSPYVKVGSGKGVVVRNKYDLEKVFMNYIDSAHPEKKEKMLANPDSKYHTVEFEKLRSNFWRLLKEKYPPLKRILTKPGYRPQSTSQKKKYLTDFEVVSQETIKS